MCKSGKASIHSLILGSAIALTGCGDNDGLTAFNLVDITAANTSSINGSGEIRQMTLTWDSASSASGINYTICQTDTNEENNCSAIATVTDVTEATIQIDSLIKAVTASYFILASDGEDTKLSSQLSIDTETLTQMIGYVKASNTVTNTRFGYSAAMSADGYTFAIGAPFESSAATGINGNDVYSDETSDGAGDEINYASASGAVYIFSYYAGSWSQSAYLKASNAEAGDQFGYAIAMSADGSTLAVSANFEGSDGSNEDNNDTAKSGAVYVFDFDGTDWTQEAYLKASNPDANDFFGSSVSLSDDGNTMAVGAISEDSSAIGAFETVPEETETVSGSGAVYVFTKAESAWSQTAYLKASNNDGSQTNDQFGYSVTLDSDGNTVAVGAPYEDSNAQGVDGDGSDNNASLTGAAYVFKYEDSIWNEVAYIKASNSNSDYTDNFGHSVSLNDDGTKLAVSAYQEDLSGTGVNPEPEYEEDGTTLAEVAGTGAVFIFDYADDAWRESAYIKASNAKENDKFGFRVVLSNNGDALAVSAYQESSSATGIDNYLDVVIPDEDEGIDAVNYVDNAGAVYLFSLVNSIWTESNYIKSSNTAEDNTFGYSLAINDDASVIVVGAYAETSASTGVNGNQFSSAAVEDEEDNIITEALNYADNAGAVYLY